MQAAPSRPLRLTRASPYRPYVAPDRSSIPMYRDPDYFCWIGRPRTPPHSPESPSEYGADLRNDFVWRFHYDELRDDDAYDLALLGKSREPRPTFSDSESD